MIDNKVYFVTGNDKKVLEAKQVLSNYSIQIEKIKMNKIEIQSDRLESIVSYALKQMPEDSRRIIVEDSGLFVKALNNFPGPYSSYVFRKIGCEGILKLMQNETIRTAKFVSIIGLRNKNKEIFIFKGEVDGKITYKKAGRFGFGFDPIFVPNGCEQTFAQMRIYQKNALSHRGKAFKAVGEWVCSQMTKHI
ncbi:MAG: XTP/dITP diphosphatase [Nitrososphaeria archaeon]